MVKILSIEDSDFERKYILDLLRKNGYEELFEASTGEKGIEEYKKNRLILY
jgi:CheY-like chemotaxis protein